MLSEQVVLSSRLLVDSASRKSTGALSSTLLIPSYLAAVSAFIFLATILSEFTHIRRAFRLPVREVAVEQPSPALATGFFSEAKESIKRNGGPGVFLFKLARLLGCLTLTAISLAAVTLLDEDAVNTNLNGKKHWGKRPKHPSRQFTQAEWIEITLCLFYAYCSLLSLLSLTLKNHLRSSVTRHVTLLLLAAFIVYAWRDLWPYATFNLSPLDPDNWLTWSRIGILSVLGVIFPLVIPRIYTPLDPSNPASKPNPEQTASYLSFMLFSFLDPIVFHASRVAHLPYESLPPLADYDRSIHLVQRSFPLLDPTIPTGRRRHIFWAILSVFRWEVTHLVFWLSLKTLMTFAGPVGINRLLDYLETRGENAVIRPWVWVVSLFIGPLVGSIALQMYIFINTGNLIRLEAILTQLVFEHAFRIRMTDVTETKSQNVTVVGTPDFRGNELEPENTPGGSDETALPEHRAPPPKKAPSVTVSDSATKKENLVGKINNMISTDLGNVTEGRDFLFLILYCPLQIILGAWMLYLVLGWASVIGMAVMVLSFPIPGYIAKIINRVQAERMKQTDARVQEITEIMNVIRMIKLFAWESKVKEKLAEKREEELNWIRKRQLWNVLNMNMNYVLPLITMIVTFTVYTLVMGKELTASRVFSAMAVFDMLRDQLHLAAWSMTQLIQAKVSLDRFDDFLHNTELLDDFTPERNNPPIDIVSQNKDSTAIGFKNATFTWIGAEPSRTPTPSRRRFTLHIDELFFKPGVLNLVIGPTGCGKTSILMALLSEMHFQPSGPDSWFSLPREGGVAYCAQESWVQNDTIKNNILFGEPFDEERYKKVLHQCALERDLTLFEAGDNTEVGEKGLTLSGGQKARVTLARAIYAQAKILLLDDMLAALDVHTSKWIVEKLFTGDLIEGRTVILVTHNIFLTAPVADYVVSLGLDGRIISKGSVEEILNQHSSLAEIKKDAESPIVGEAGADNPDPVKKDGESNGKLIVAEEVALGRVGWPALKMYFTSLGGPLFWLAFLTGILMADLFSICQTYWLGYWARQYEESASTEVPVPFYITIYGLLLIAGMLAFTFSTITYLFGALRASRNIHNKLVDAMLGTTFRWLDATPIGRVISRFTLDLRAVDGTISMFLSDLVELTVTLLLRFGAVVVFSPIFVIPGAVITWLGSWSGQIYIRAQLAVKREMSNSRSPVFSHFGAAIAGLVSIRAYGAQNAFKSESLRRIDLYTRPARTFYNLNRWICIRVDALGGAFASGLAAWLIYAAPTDASKTGFSLTMAVSFSSMILWWVRILNEFEVQGNSLERIESYISAEQEPNPSADGKPPAYWPASGSLRVERLCASYSVGGPDVLHDISFEIQSGERVGVVGRTGSGKSSLTLSLLRLIPTRGTVYYDGIPTSRINLDALRGNITIIPQQPELLSGSLRQNLDPFGEHDDATLNAALQASGLYNLQSEDDEARIGLDTSVTAGGTNFSLGQRQIIALARAIVRSSKIMILDEATAGVDHDTDATIQASIRTELQGVTLIIVAHRLATIMDADKVMVLDEGKLVEFGRPAELLQIQGGKFRSLVDHSGDKEQLRELANRR